MGLEEELVRDREAKLQVHALKTHTCAKVTKRLVLYLDMQIRKPGSWLATQRCILSSPDLLQRELIKIDNGNQV